MKRLVIVFCCVLFSVLGFSEGYNTISVPSVYCPRVDTYVEVGETTVTVIKEEQGIVSTINCFESEPSNWVSKTKVVYGIKKGKIVVLGRYRCEIEYKEETQKIKVPVEKWIEE